MTRSMLAAAVMLSGAAPALAQQTAAGLSGDLMNATKQVETKVLGLANVMSAAQYDWRPAQGVRSVGEVLLHIAADNYFLPIALGVAAPAATKIVAGDYATVQAYENQQLGRDATIAEVRASFEHLQRAMAQIPESRMNETLTLFGTQFTVRSLLLLTTTHLHEHLGQMIAYARSNGVTPPWSR
ncbi:MAG TPA: DinB family protein [Longimicrobiales bacterium]|nr:DinB family protein [Longimicrobiales bacterium]